MNRSSVNCGLMMNVQNFYIEGNRLKMQWLQCPGQGNVDDLNSVIHEAS